jgi:hypothetical protein
LLFGVELDSSDINVARTGERNLGVEDSDSCRDVTLGVLIAALSPDVIVINIEVRLGSGSVVVVSSSGVQDDGRDVVNSERNGFVQLIVSQENPVNGTHAGDTQLVILVRAQLALQRERLVDALNRRDSHSQGVEGKIARFLVSHHNVEKTTV